MKKISRRRFMQAAGAAAVVGMASTTGLSAGACLDLFKPDAGYPQKAVIHSFDWGPAVTATILKLDDSIQADSVRAEDFSVIENKEAFDWTAMSGAHTVVSAPRQVTDAYACTSGGSRTTLPTRYIRLEMRYDPNTGSPFCYDLFTGKNTWCSPYELEVSLSAQAALTSIWGKKVTALGADPAIDFEDALIPELADFHLTGKMTGSDGRTLDFAYYTPILFPGRQVPLVIWLHGAGEGGEDPRLALLGNKVAPLAGKEFQDAMGGSAFVLVPQTPGFWLEYNEEGDWQDNPGTESVYTNTLTELINAFAREFPIDANRVLIGGCSNGGYMTMNMVLRYPNSFAAAFPICEAYKDSGITEEQLASIKDLPLWFVYAKNDTVVNPEEYEIPTIERLQAIGANVRTSVFDDVHDTSGLYFGEDGLPYQYQGHWSWIYFFNNECVDTATGESLWDWLGRQSK